MINLKSIRLITLVAFIKIASLIFYLYLDVTDKITGNYTRYLLMGLSLTTFIVIVFYLLGILKFLREGNAVLIAFKVFVGFELISFAVNIAVSMLLFPKLHYSYLYINYYYGIIEIIRFFILLYLTIQLARIQDAILRPSFVFFGGALLVACILITVTPFYTAYIIQSMSVKPPANIMRHIYTYAGMANILPLIAVLIILNQVQERLNYVEETAKKDPFLTGYEEKSEEK
ncbi:MAG: hypothetical protein JWR38_1746 [Mucilaginibacter sp.]|nr:hypothetical protein [Mucilaginibacter sp.]